MGTRPAATKGLVMGVPSPELEADDAGLSWIEEFLYMHYVLRNSIQELSIHALCIEELNTSKDLSDTLEADDSGITLLL